MAAFPGDSWSGFHTLLYTDGDQHDHAIAEAVAIYPDARTAAAAFTSGSKDAKACDGQRALSTGGDAAWKFSVPEINADTVRWTKQQIGIPITWVCHGEARLRNNAVVQAMACQGDDGGQITVTTMTDRMSASVGTVGAVMSEDLEHALAGGAPQRVGWFRFHFADQRWGGRPRSSRCTATSPARWSPPPNSFSRTNIRTTTARWQPRSPRSAAPRARSAPGTASSTPAAGAFRRRHRGPALRRFRCGHRHPRLLCRRHAVAAGEKQELLNEAVAEIAESRSAIDQAKGHAHAGLPDHRDTAFELLRWRSQETNVKLRVLAEQIIRDFLALEYDETLPDAATDRLLLTAHPAAT